MPPNCPTCTFNAAYWAEEVKCTPTTAWVSRDCYRPREHSPGPHPFLFRATDNDSGRMNLLRDFLPRGFLIRS